MPSAVFNRRDLLTAWRSVRRGVSRDPGQPILNCVLLSGRDGRASITGSSHDAGATLWFADSDDFPALAIPSIPLGVRLAVGQSDTAHFSWREDRDWIRLKMDRFEFDLPRLPARAYPFPQAQSGGVQSPAGEISAAIRCHLSLLAMCEQRGHDGLQVDFGDQTLSFTAGDGRFLSVSKAPFSGDPLDDCLIPRSAARTLQASLPEDARITISRTEGQIFFTWPSGVVWTALLGSTLRDWSRQIEIWSMAQRQVSLLAGDLRAAVEAVLLSASDDSHIGLTIHPSSTEVFTRSESGGATVTLDSESSEQSPTPGITLAGPPLLAFLRTVPPTETLSIRHGDPGNIVCFYHQRRSYFQAPIQK